MRAPNVFTVPLGAPFLDTLVEALLDGRLIAGFAADDPFALADTTLYLPTRRAARAIRESFLARLGRPLLLPRIRTLGDIDEDDVSEAEADAEAPELPPAIAGAERQLVLTRLVLGWSGALVRAAAGIPEEELAVPSSPADAARLAADLGRLIDHVGTEREAWRGLFSGVPADLAQYWQITLKFLEIATEAWPAHLAERGRMDPGRRRDLLVRAEAARLAAHGSATPVIAAGSTGSVPATAALLTAIAGLSNGAVVLPGLDQDLDAGSWDEIAADARDPAGAGHPQYGLKLLLGSLGAIRDRVEPLAQAPTAQRARGRFISEAMRPAATTELWTAQPALDAAEKQAALADVALVEAATEREEALAAAVILRQAAETPGRNAALVTPDRALARRVAVELGRWEIAVDDSAGQPLSRTPPGVLARLVAEVSLGGAEAETLLALGKHPLAGFGLGAPRAHAAARALERAALRGPRLKPGLAALRAALAHATERRFSPEPNAASYPAQAARSLARWEFEAAAELARRIEAALAPLEALAAVEGSVPLADLMEAHRAALLEAGRDAAGGHPFLAGETGEALARSFEAIGEGAPRGPDIAPGDYPALFAALIEGAMVRRGGLDPRIHIWGALEARLQRVDTVVLAGLNEGTWPTQTRLDPLLSRPMRAALALEPPERRIGLAAHDFAQAFGHPAVWLTRAKRQDGEPRVASRWLQRLAAYAGADLADAMRARGAEMLALARRLDAPAALDRPQRPRPAPPVALRPKKLSATQIETLIRDPYAIYAREILRLRPFEPIAKLPEASERGILLHDILETFIAERPAGPFDAAALERLVEIGRAEFARHADFPEIVALWWPRFERIAAWFVAMEAGRTGIVHRHVENTGRIEVTADFALTARADRIDRLADGSVSILDYKTGSPPTIDAVLALTPQLPLEGLIARSGGFADVPAAEPSALVYYRLNGRGEGGEEQDRSYRAAKGGKPEVTLPQALALTEARLAALAAQFADPQTEYLSRKIPKRGRVYVAEYDHLARVAEWVATEEEEDWTPAPP